MFEEKAGELAGKIWEALNTAGELSGKDLKVRADKDLYLALGWLLREDKLTIKEEAKDILVSLK